MLVTVLQTARLSHSEIFGSRVICTYPKLIAAYHVLHRLHEPRHPPCALVYFLSPQPSLLSSMSTMLTSKAAGWSLILSAVLLWLSSLTTCVLLYSFACVNMSKIDGNFELWDLNFELFNLWSPLFLKDCSREWRITDSNRWPPACKAGALASWANPPWVNFDFWMLSFDLSPAAMLTCPFLN